MAIDEPMRHTTSLAGAAAAGCELLLLLLLEAHPAATPLASTRTAPMAPADLVNFTARSPFRPARSGSLGWPYGPGTGTVANVNRN